MVLGFESKNKYCLICPSAVQVSGSARTFSVLDGQHPMETRQLLDGLKREHNPKFKLDPYI